MQVSSLEISGAVRSEVGSAVSPSPFEAFKTVAPATAETQLAAAEKRFGADREGKAIWGLAVGQLDAEHAAAAAADAAKESAEKQAKKILAGKQAEQKIDRLTTAIARGKRRPLTEEDKALVKNVVTPEQKMALAQGVLDQAAEEQNQMRLRAEARGAKPNESLAKEAGLLRRASREQQGMIETGLEMVQILKTEPLTLNELREATAAEKRFKRAEKRRGGLFDKLVDRFSGRYPDRAEQLKTERTKIDEDLKAKRDALTVAAAEVLPQEQKVARAESAITDSGVERDATKAALAEQLGVVTSTEADGTTKKEVKEGSLLDVQLTAEATVAALDNAFAEAVKAAEDDPRLADRALQIGLERHIAMKTKEISTERIARLQAVVKENEAVQVAKEQAQAEGDKKKLEAAGKWDKGLKAFNKFFGTAIARVAQMPGAVVGGIGVGIEAVGLVIKVVGFSEMGVVEGAKNAFVGTLEVRAAGRVEDRDAAVKAAEAEITRLQAELARLKGEPAAA